MKCIYIAADPVEAEIVRGLLCAERIACVVFGAALWSGRGEIAADPYPRVMLQDPRDEAQARELIAVYQRGRVDPGPDWTCSCGESVPASMALCWACGEPPPPRA